MKLLQKVGGAPIGLAVPALVIQLAVFGIPMVLLFLKSFNAPDWSLANYQAFVAQSANVRVLIQTIEVSVIATVICLIIGYPMAYAITYASKKVRAALIALVIVPYLTSTLVRTYAWIVILGDGGLVNTLLRHLGLIDAPLKLIYTSMAVYIGMVHIMLPVMILPLVSVMLGIDKSLMAAARSMGARPFAAFWRVFFPLSMSGVRSGSLLVFVLSLGFYIMPAALGGLRDVMLSNFIAAQVSTSLDMPRIAAIAFILLGIAGVMLAMLGLDLSGTKVSAATRAPKARRLQLHLFSPVARYVEQLVARQRARRWTAKLYRAINDHDWLKPIGTAFVLIVMFYLLFPSVIVVVMSFSAGVSLEFPPSGYSLQWYRSFFGNASWTDAAWTSIKIGVTVTVLATIVGTLAAYGLSRSAPRLRTFTTLLMLTPITFPSIVVGVAAYLGLLNLGLTGTKFGIMLAHSVGAIGYVVVVVSATLSNFDPNLEQAAKSMRATPLKTFARITLPLISPGVIGGAVFAFIHSFDEVVKSSLVSGFTIRTLPLKMWENMRNEIDPTIAAVASMLVLLPVLWLFAIYITWWRSRPKAHGALLEQPPVPI